MRIALDYDGTYTSDPQLWIDFINSARANGHVVHIVTMRFPSECKPARFVKGLHQATIDERLIEMGVSIIATSRKAKRKFCEALGWAPHVWIDDIPEAIVTDAAILWPKTNANEGAPIVPHYE